MRSVYQGNTILSIIAGFILILCASACMAQTVITPPESTFFSTIGEESYSTYQIPGNGDLWPSCWADDGNLYAANGDGTNFGTTFYPMAVGKITGTAADLTLSGSFVVGDVGFNYSGSPYTDKPTGMLCIGGDIYLAYQNLNENTFEDAPAASIVESTDHGATWSQNPLTPMFGTPGDTSNPASYLFTTIFFLDFGQNYANAIDNYVYAYGLDNDWRDQTAVYLARVPNTSVLDRSSWQFYEGMNGNTPTWTSDITQKVAVLTDQRLLYPVMFGTDCPPDQKIIAQGGVVYDKPLNRYLMVTWGCATHEFYEAPQPWGPWSHFYEKDFGPLRLLQNRGQYGTSIPSKFISSDGLTVYLQSNVCCSGDSYTFSLRKVYLAQYTPTSPSNTYSNTNLALEPGTRAISKSTHYGTLCAVNCADQMVTGTPGNSEDDWDEEVKTTDWWGYTWPQSYNINQVLYTTGTIFSNGGWYSSDLTVQVRQNFQWIDVAGVAVTPTYPYSSAAGSQTTYDFTFPDTWGDGVRIIGTPGGTAYFTSVDTMAVYYASSTLSPSFSISASPDSLSIAHNASGAASVTLTPADGFTGTVSLSCSVTTTPTGVTSPVTCSIPASAGVTGSTPATVTLNVNSSANTTSGAYAITVTGTSGSMTETAVIDVTVNPATSPTFTVTASPVSPPSIAAGSSAESTITVETTNGYVGSVTLNCALSEYPSGAIYLPVCSIANGSISLSSTAPSGTATATVTSTAAMSSQFARTNLGRPWKGAGGGIILTLLVFLGSPARRRKWRAMLGVFIVLASLGTLSGCGGGNSDGGGGAGSSGTTAGTYTFTVTGTGSPSVTPAPASTFSVTVN